jgi:hypothetical protein
VCAFWRLYTTHMSQFLMQNLVHILHRFREQFFMAGIFLRQGMIKRIGDGRFTNIWTGSWLPCDHLMKPLISLQINPPQLVSELIDETSATWRDGVIHQVFLPMDASAILSSPLCTMCQQKDIWPWKYDKKGRLTAWWSLQKWTEITTMRVMSDLWNMKLMRRDGALCGKLLYRRR